MKTSKAICICQPGNSVFSTSSAKRHQLTIRAKQRSISSLVGPAMRPKVLGSPPDRVTIRGWRMCHSIALVKPSCCKTLRRWK